MHLRLISIYTYRVKRLKLIIVLFCGVRGFEPQTLQCPYQLSLARDKFILVHILLIVVEYETFLPSKFVSIIEYMRHFIK